MSLSRARNEDTFWRSDSLAQISGPVEPALLEETFSEKFSAICNAFPDRIAIKTPNSQLSYKGLDEQSEALATGLLTLKIKTGDRVVISLGNGIPYAVVSYACFKIGAIAVPLNPAYTPDQVISALNHISASCLFLSTDITLPYKPPTSTAPLLESLLGSTRELNSCPLPVNSLRHVFLIKNSINQVEKPIFKSTIDYDQLISDNHGRQLPNQGHLRNSDIATIQFTSGTTSAPKAACLSHKSILNNGFLVGRGMDLTERDIVCCPPPLYHCFGLVLGLLAVMTHGACIILPSEAFDAREVLRSIENDRPTALYGVPTMFLAELELLSQGLFYLYPPHVHSLTKRFYRFITKKDFSHLRTGIIGGSPIPSSLRLTLHEKLNLSDLASCYGLTETSPIVCMTTSSDTLEQKLNTVGGMLPHTFAKIVSRDDPTRTLRYGEKGELLISGYCVMAGYWKDESRTSEALNEENCPGEKKERKIWFRTGDEALIQPDGYIRITGRIKDIIIRGGENIYPPEIENVLLQHPLILNASIVGLPDVIYGEVVAAFIIVKGDGNEEHGAAAGSLSKDSVRGWVQARLSKMLVPKHIFWVLQMPLTASGKIEKYKLKDFGVQWLREKETGYVGLET
ncbi:hypothetical protein V499_01176 [Pseudogymnoascus sp. VKM F-103]|nr:hypothetical protein V499_01176 [Pseudogymnoascus sp. VKM F-103]